MVVERGGEQSDPAHYIKRLTQYSCWANAAWIDFIERNRSSESVIGPFVICDL
jgi:hypothetical protein